MLRLYKNVMLYKNRYYILRISAFYFYNNKVCNIAIKLLHLQVCIIKIIHRIFILICNMFSIIITN